MNEAQERAVRDAVMERDALKAELRRAQDRLYLAEVKICKLLGGTASEPTK